ncbi:carbohydrate porin [Thermosulfurimonas sp. F29]|uniref:carbohydrate porin n=1 Tax=Thermosulfurimonas sp. F29 TaxID=2867247 RepID=UPI001C84005B|nr:carbohydrate porin [Thermosulfurimonas sp. F29]MBX6422248.1 carbohydrate porin [Thermosulfurimonas sp. F29]
MRRVVLLGILFWVVLSLGAALAADPEVEELKRMLRQVMEENRRLAERVSELERRLAAYERERSPVAETAATGAERPWYERVEVGLSVAGLVQGVVGVDREAANLHAHGGREPAGNIGPVITDEDKAYGAAAVDLELSAEFSERDRAYVLLEMGSGKNPDSEVPSFSGIVDEALSMVPVETEDGDVRVSEAWYEREWAFGSGRFRFRFGKIDITTEVDQNAYANDENGQFMSPVFVNNAAVEWASYSFGMVASYETERWALTLGYEDADSSWDNLFDYPFLVGQLAVSTEFLGRPGNYRFYVWYQGEKHLEWDELEDYFASGGARSPENDKAAWGFGLSFDQEVAEGVGVFLRYGWRGGDLAGYWNGDLTDLDFSYGFEQAASAGISVSGRLWGREGDELGLGVAWFGISDDYEDYWEAKGVYAARLGFDPHMHRHEARDEWHLEVYYRLKAAEHLALTPDLQYTWNPAGLRDDGFWVFTLRGVWEY